MRIYLIRHADPDYENDTITEAGHLEAQALAKRMSALPLTNIHVSPMGRARATAKYTAEALALDPVVEDWTEELSQLRTEDPRWQGRMAWDIPGEAIRTNYDCSDQEAWFASGPFRFPAVNTAVQTIAAASDLFLKGYGYEREGRRYRIVKPSRAQIAVFCHGGFGLFWLSHLLGIPLPMVWSSFWLAPSSVTTLLMDERDETWAAPRCLGLADASHPYAAGLPVRPRGIYANFD
ncbi:hypothetical protein MASR2M78_21810 [Treponema sp.]